MTTDEDDRPRCSGCGRAAGPERPAWMWSTERTEHGAVSLCPDCTRDHARDIEAKLDPEWW
ncbi:MAG TPA: hypothetical protein VK020_12000 [Microlunatus sp.]|nr:hypothetical protein [Microlunatus sp.]